MIRPTRPLRRSLVFGTTAAIGLGGALIATPAFATTSTETAPYDEKTATEILSDPAVQIFGQDDDGNVVIVTLEGESSDTVDDFAAEYDNVEVKTIAAQLDAFAETDVVGGAGYYSPIDEQYVALCSIGFSAWDPDGNEAAISAGHCAEDEGNFLDEVTLTTPADDEAAGSSQPSELAPFGNFGFSQYGGVGNTTGAEDTDSIDVAVIDKTNAALDLKPEVTDWTTPADLSQSTTTITAVGKPDPDGANIEKSGRTTGHTTASASDIDVVDGWANVGGRLVYGFGVVGLESDHGDSGGAVYQGTTAVGILSGGLAPGEDPSLPNGYTWAADLQNNLDHTGGYTLQLFIEAPAVSTSGEVEAGSSISGTAPTGTTVVVTPASGDPFEVSVDGSGNWSFPAPSQTGDYAFSVVAKNGYNVSASASGSVTILAAPLDAPVISTPADGSTVYENVTEISGTGTPGAVVTLTGDVTGTAEVTSAGAWSVPTDLGYGSYEVSATQAADGETSAATTASFTVALTPVAITSPTDGQEFEAGSTPTEVSGTGADGSTVVVTINGDEIGTAEPDAEPAAAEGELSSFAATVSGGEWSIPIDIELGTGEFTIVATQTLDGQSNEAQSTFTIAAAETPGGGDDDGDDDGSGNGTGDPQLPVTGSELAAPLAGLAALLLLAGAGVLVLRKRAAVRE